VFSFGDIARARAGQTGFIRSVICAVVCAVAIGALPVSTAAAQRNAAPREPQRFLASAVLASAGAIGGFLVGAALAPREGTLCPTVPGGTCSGGTPHPLGVVAGSALGAAAGATLGARLFGGRQNFVRSAGGAALGIFVGAALAGSLDSESDGVLAVSFVVPTGVLAAWVGR
jgi:hypothetical protein